MCIRGIYFHFITRCQLLQIPREEAKNHVAKADNLLLSRIEENNECDQARMTSHTVPVEIIITQLAFFRNDWEVVGSNNNYTN